MARGSSKTRAGARIDRGHGEEKNPQTKVDEIEHKPLPLGCEGKMARAASRFNAERER